MSVPQIPHAATRIRTSPAPISGTGTSSTNTLPCARYTAARIVVGTRSRIAEAFSLDVVPLINVPFGPLICALLIGFPPPNRKPIQGRHGLWPEWRSRAKSDPDIRPVFVTHHACCAQIGLDLA